VSLAARGRGAVDRRFVAALVLLLAVGCARNLRSESTAEEGEASWYGPGLYGRKTASGEVLRPGMLTAAHRTLPFGTCLRVTNLENGRAVEVRVNDRGPYAAGRILDVSEAAAGALGMRGRGVTRVRLERCPGTSELPAEPAEDFQALGTTEQSKVSGTFDSPFGALGTDSRGAGGPHPPEPKVSGTFGSAVAPDRQTAQHTCPG